MGGDAEAGDAGGAAELEQATVTAKLAQDQLDALEVLERIFCLDHIHRQPRALVVVGRCVAGVVVLWYCRVAGFRCIASA
jgi:hypothetical protein